MKLYQLIILLISVFSCSQAQVNYAPSWIVGFIHSRAINEAVLAPYDIIFDSTRDAVMPKMYRSPVFFKNSPNQNFDITGFNQLQVSGSAQYSLSELKELVSHIHKRHKVAYDKIYVIDLREEPHAFINDAAVSWYYGPLNVQQNKSSGEVIASDYRRIAQVRAFSTVFINTIEKSVDGMPSEKKTEIYPVTTVISEQEAVNGLGAHYIRIPVTDHFRPEGRDVDEFVNFVTQLPAGAWLHFKCRGGKGRTTTFMVFLDIIRNPAIALDQIFARHKALGGTDLSDSKKIPPIQKAWKYRLSSDRTRLIQTFYDYRHASDGWGKMKFSDWVQKHAKYLGYLGEGSSN